MSKSMAVEKTTEENSKGINKDRYMLARFYGTFVVPDETRVDKKREKRFACKIVAPKSLLAHNFNFQSHFKYTQKQAFMKHCPEFIRFKNVIFDYATEMDGSEIKDPRTYSLDRLKAHCVEKGYQIDFDLYAGLQLRSIVFEYFERRDRVDESDAFYRRQEHDKRVRGLVTELRTEAELVPENQRITFEEV